MKILSPRHSHGDVTHRDARKFREESCTRKACSLRTTSASRTPPIRSRRVKNQKPTIDRASNTTRCQGVAETMPGIMRLYRRRAALRTLCAVLPSCTGEHPMISTRWDMRCRRESRRERCGAEHATTQQPVRHTQKEGASKQHFLLLHGVIPCVIIC